MRKRNKGRKFGRETAQRKALLNSLAQNLFIHGKMKTTLAKAKEVRMFAEKMITKAKVDNLITRRALSAYFTADIVKKLTKEIAVSYKDRKGGYTRIIKAGQRTPDGAVMAIIELVK